MNNEPVAWMSEFGQFIGKVQDEICHIPLYIHPVKEYKEPSVKEIDDLWLDVINNIPANDHRPREWHFANAILTKASENE